MRLATLVMASCLLAQAPAWASPPGYHTPRRHYTAGNLPYVRPPLRLVVGGNVAYYNGDLTNRLQDQTLQPGFSLGFAHLLSPRVTFTTELGWFKLKANDYYPERSYSFTNTVGLLQSTLRLHLLEDKSMYIGMRQKQMPVQVFAEAGVGLMLSSPTAYAPDSLGQRVTLPHESNASYPILAAAFPVGIGTTLRASKQLYFTVNALYYFTTTDLLDDVSRRGNAKQPDNFATLSLKVEYALGKRRQHPLNRAD